jgi:hypothetical protein
MKGRKYKRDCRKVALKSFFALSFCSYIHQLEHRFPTAQWLGTRLMFGYTVLNTGSAKDLKAATTTQFHHPEIETEF